MKIFVIVGHNRRLDNVSARAAYSSRAQAEAHLADRERMWFDDDAAIVELEVDREEREPLSPSPLESSADAAGEWDVDARMAEAYGGKQGAR